ncbi:hypothetical protein ACLB2K_051139 [Fragaria x ananassa]
MLYLKLGYSHEVELTVPPAVRVFCFKNNVVCCTGIDKNRVHQYASAVRGCKPPEVYKGKGIMFTAILILTTVDRISILELKSLKFFTLLNSDWAKTLPTAWSRRHKPKSSGKKDGTPPQSTPKTSNSASTVESNRQHLLDGGLHEKLQSRFEDHDDGERNGRRRWDDAAQGFQLEGESGEVRFESQYVGFLTGDEAVGGGGQAIQ